MKKIVSALFLTVVALPGMAQQINANEVPAPVKTAFEKQFPGFTTAKWEMEDGNYEAEFSVRGVENSAIYSASGTFIQQESEIPVASLPAGATKFVADNLKDKKIKEASKVTLADGTVKYEAEIDHVDYFFDAEGKFINRKMQVLDAAGEKD